MCCCCSPSARLDGDLWVDATAAELSIGSFASKVKRSCRRRIKGARLVESMRLGVENGSSGTTVMVALVKAGFEICHASAFDYGVAGGRRSIAHVFRLDLVTYEACRPILDFLRQQSATLGLRYSGPRRRAAASRKRTCVLRVHGAHGHPDIRIDYERVFGFRAAAHRSAIPWMALHDSTPLQLWRWALRVRSTRRLELRTRISSPRRGRTVRGPRLRMTVVHSDVRQPTSMTGPRAQVR